MVKQNRAWLIGIGIAGTLIAAFILLLLVVYTGAYNVSATSGHTAFGRWALETTMRSSVQARADVEAPAMTAAMVAAGAGHYKSMCQHCHGGPGVSRAEWAEGIVPSPPQLSHAANEWEPGEVFWIVKHGIKMSAMPAFGPTHSDEDLWNIVAFVERLPAMTPQEYAAFPSGHHGGGSGEAHGNAAAAQPDSHQHSHRD